MWQDIRFACRTLAKVRGFTIVALMTLTLGIGANVTVFTFVNSLYLAPLPYRDPERLVRVMSTPMTDRVSRQAWFFRMMTDVLAIFAGLSLVMAAAGIYGVASYGVVERTGEIGVRMAMGASKGDVMRMFLSESLRRTVFAFALGLVISLMLVSVLERTFAAVEPSGIGPYVLVAALLGAVTLGGTCLPAFRAARLESTVALRHE